MSSEDADRQRIARELHDDLSRQLALLNREIDQLDLSLDDDGLSERVRDLSQELERIASHVQRLSHELHPAGQGAQGLVASIARLCRDVAAEHAIEIDCTHHSMPADIPPDVSLCAYRIVQEALNNVVKHSGVTRAAIRMAVADGVLSVQVADPGRSFSVDGGTPAGLGLITMRERAAAVGGEIVIQSSPGAGTRIAFRVPLRATADPSARPGLVD
jgi:signal transduction histidine kinase